PRSTSQSRSHYPPARRPHAPARCLALNEEGAFAAPLRIRLSWIAALAFASGFPFGLINEAVPIYLRTHGASLVDIGHLAKLSLTWSLKWLWAPLVDRYGSRRRWIAGCLAS